MRMIVTILATLLLVACAASGEPQDRAREMAVYERHAGAAERWVRYTSIRNWWSVGYHSVVLEMNRSRHYLVDLIGSCDLDLNSAVTMRIENSRRNVLSEFDKVHVGGHGCQIQSIRRVDLPAVRAALEAEDLSVPDGRQDVDQSSGGT